MWLYMARNFCQEKNFATCSYWVITPCTCARVNAIGFVCHLSLSLSSRKLPDRPYPFHVLTWFDCTCSTSMQVRVAKSWSAYSYVYSSFNAGYATLQWLNYYTHDWMHMIWSCYCVRVRFSCSSLSGRQPPMMSEHGMFPPNQYTCTFSGHVVVTTVMYVVLLHYMCTCVHGVRLNALDIDLWGCSICTCLPAYLHVDGGSLIVLCTCNCPVYRSC